MEVICGLAAVVLWSCSAVALGCDGIDQGETAVDEQRAGIRLAMLGSNMEGGQILLGHSRLHIGP